MEKEMVKKRLQKIFPTLKITVENGLDKNCPYDGGEVDGEKSFVVYGGGRLFGRILFWVEGGISFEWDYIVPQNPTVSITWLVMVVDGENAWENFLWRLEFELPAFIAYVNMAGRGLKHKWDRYYNLCESYQKIGFYTQSE